MVVTNADRDSYDYRDLVPVRRALISVSDKSGLLELAQGLAAAGVEIVSTGSTAAQIRDAGYSVTDVASVTGFAEALDGRVKTLHPAIHAGLLADLRLADHRQQLISLGYGGFELVVVNLYPFAQTVQSGADEFDVIENIDIGGPAMVRASAKNHANVAIVTDPAQYDSVLAAVNAGGTDLALRRKLATEAFVHTTNYDGEVANWMLERSETDWAAPEGASDSAAESVDYAESEVDLIFAPAPENSLGYQVTGVRHAVLRYGENSHQRAALFTDLDSTGLAQAEQLGGKEMSYNNFVDADAALRAAYDHQTPAVAIVKHTNPCGIAVAYSEDTDIAEAHAAAHDCDPLSAFGGVIAVNRTVTVKMAARVAEIFTEVLVAPDFEPAALEILQTKKNLRLLRLPESFVQAATEIRHISGGFLVQDSDRSFASNESWQLVTECAADSATLSDLAFAQIACRAVKSNAILLAAGGASVGIGMGQVNRVDSARLAVQRAGARAHGSVAASDAFFPFADGFNVLAEAGVKAVVQPGGSVRDDEVIAAANAAGVAMYFTGQRHFAH